MLNLTNTYHDGQPLLLACRHIVAIRPDPTGSEILTVTGVVYWVKETPEAIGKMNAWERLA